MTKTSKSNSRGQGIVEFTLVLPLLLVLVGGATDWGLGFFVSHVVQNASREGARIAVTLPNLTANDARVLAAVNSKIPGISLFSGFTVTSTTPAGPLCGQEVTVQVAGSYSFSFLRLLGFTTIPISRATTMRYELQQPCA